MNTKYPEETKIFTRENLNKKYFKQTDELQVVKDWAAETIAIFNKWQAVQMKSVGMHVV